MHFAKNVLCIISFCDFKNDNRPESPISINVETYFSAKAHVYIFNLGLNWKISTRAQLFCSRSIDVVPSIKPIIMKQ